MIALFRFRFALLVCFFRLVTCFPEDLQPNLVLRGKDTIKLPLFFGKGPHNDNTTLDVQEIKLIDEKILIGSRNAFFVLSQSSFSQATGAIEYDQMRTWDPTSRSLCKQRTTLYEKCENYIRVIVQTDRDKVLLCGTNSQKPECRTYAWSSSSKQFEGGYKNTIERDDIIFPSNHDDSLAYHYTDGYMFLATKISIVTNEVLMRVDVINFTIAYPNISIPLPVLRTKQSESWFNHPRFVKILDVGDKVLLFFKETSLEASDDTDKVVYSRVVQVCKDDEGGGRLKLLESRWTSFFKARLNCSLPGNPHFYFNELQHVTSPVQFNGKRSVFATFTTPESHIAGSAVCAFSLDEIRRVMMGKFQSKRQSNCQQGTESISPSPTSCNVIKKNNIRMLEFINSHQSMAEVVQPVDNQALFFSAKSGLRFTAIAVEVNAPVQEGKAVTVMYIGTKTGQLLKVVTSQMTENSSIDARQRKTVFSEEWNVFREDRCSSPGSKEEAESDQQEKDKDRSDKRVLNITLLSDFVLVSLRHCVISVPKKVCSFYKSKSACTQPGNPYCRWQSDACLPVNGAGSTEQDVSGEGETNEESGGVPEAQANDFTTTLIVGLVSLFIIMLLIVFLVLHFQGICWFHSWSPEASYQSKKTKGVPVMSESNVNIQPGVHVRLAKRSSFDDVAVTSPTQSTASFRAKIGHPQPLNNMNENCNAEFKSSALYESNIAGSQSGYSRSGTIWSDDSSVAKEMLSKQPPQGGGRYLSTNNSNSYCHKTFDTFVRTEPINSDSATGPVKVQLSSYIYPSAIVNTPKQTAPSRILTNPNYLPLQPNTYRHFGSQNLENDFDKTTSTLTTFSLDHQASRDGGNTTSRAPGGSLGSCSVPPADDEHLTTLNNFRSEAPSKLIPAQKFFSNNTEERNCISSNSQNSSLLSSPKETASLSGSMTSGFVSCSPEEGAMTSSRKALIVAKGILAAQHTLSSPCMRKKRMDERMPKRDSGEHDYDEVYDSSSSLEQSPNSLLTNEEEKVKTGNVFFPSPEYLQSSEEDEEDYVNLPAPPTLLANDCRKKSLNIFKALNKKKKTSKRQSDESFRSPAYDEELTVPRVEGWQEIEFPSSFSRLCNNVERQCFHDDSLIDRCRKQSCRSEEGAQFYTMRPKRRMTKVRDAREIST